MKMRICVGNHKNVGERKEKAHRRRRQTVDKEYGIVRINQKKEWSDD